MGSLSTENPGLKNVLKPQICFDLKTPLFNSFLEENPGLKNVLKPQICFDLKTPLFNSFLAKTLCSVM